MIYKVCHCYCMIAFFSKKLSSSFHTINGLRYGTVTGSGLERSYSNSKDSVTPWQGSGRLLVGKSLYPLVSSYPRITSTSHLVLWKYWTYWHDCCWSGNRDLNTSDIWIFLPFRCAILSNFPWTEVTGMWRLEADAQMQDCLVWLEKKDGKKMHIFWKWSWLQKVIFADSQKQCAWKTKSELLQHQKQWWWQWPGSLGSELWAVNIKKEAGGEGCEHGEMLSDNS